MRIYAVLLSLLAAATVGCSESEFGATQKSKPSSNNANKGTEEPSTKPDVSDLDDKDPTETVPEDLGKDPDEVTDEDPIPTPENNSGTGLCDDNNNETSTAIATVADLRAMKRGYYHLANDLVLTGEWEPFAITGVRLDGNNHKISGLKVSKPTVDRVGLFSTIQHTCIKELTIEGAVVSGKSYVGALVGEDKSLGSNWVKSITIKNSSIEGTGPYVGGLSGSKNGGGVRYDLITIDTVTVASPGDYVGGVSGLIKGGGATLSTANIKVTVSGGSFVGGAIGEIRGGSALIEGIVMDGSVTGSGNHVAGIFGKMSGGGARAKVLRADGAVNAPGNNVARIGGLLEGGRATFLDAKSSAKLNGASPSGLKESLLGTHTGGSKVYEP